MENQQQQNYDGYTNRDSSFNTIDTGSGFHHTMNSYLYINSKHTTEPPSIIFKVYCELIFNFAKYARIMNLEMSSYQ